MKPEDFHEDQPLSFADRVEIIKEDSSKIRAYIERWNNNLSEASLETFNYLKDRFAKGYDNANDKQYFKQCEIEEYSKHESSENIFIAKGFKWFKLGRNYALRQFLLLTDETVDDLRINHNKFYDRSAFTSELTILPRWRIQEQRFNAAAKGWGYAKFVDYINNLNGKPEKTIYAPVIALFCKLVSESQLMPKHPEENNEQYCKRICSYYRLEYTDRVRQNFSNQPTRKNKQSLKDQIFTLIDTDTINVLSALLLIKK